MKEKMHSGGSMLRCDSEDFAIAAALHDDVDIPAMSASFAQRCLTAAAGVQFTSGGRSFRGRRLFMVMAGVAVLSSLATSTVALAVAMAMGRGGRMASSTLSVALDDVSAVGVKAPIRGNGRFTSSKAGKGLAMSNECMVNTDPGATVFWKALNAGQSQMAWEWPDGAKSAKLTITGRGIAAEKVYCKSDAFPVWNPPVPEGFNEDDVYTARLTFYRGVRGTGGEVARLVANGIGFVRGVSGAEPRVAGDDVTNANLAMFGAVKWVVRGK